MLHACVHERRKDSIHGGLLVDFSKSFQGGQNWRNLFLPFETKKTAFFAEIFKFLPFRPGP